MASSIRRNLFLCVFLFAILLVAGAPALEAQDDDLSGSWLMDMSADVPEAVEPCIYSGDCEMSQDGNQLTGTVDLMLVSGPEDCPAEMTAALGGNVDGDDVSGTLSGADGEADFTGSRANSFVGTFQATEGAFAGSDGEWVAVRPLVHVTEIPTLAGAGLTLLVLALLGAGGWVLRSRRSEQSLA
jgi:hypothetical protein